MSGQLSQVNNVQESKMIYHVLYNVLKKGIPPIPKSVSEKIRVPSE